jgi:hypothetical protein
MAQQEMTSTTPPATSPATPRRSLFALWAVVFVCAAPVVAAFAAYFFFKPEGGKSYGQLVMPQRPAVPIRGATLDGAPFEFSQLNGRWTMVIAAPAACDDTCRTQLYNMRQIRTSTGKERARVERVWLVTDAAPVNIPLLKEHEGLVVVRADPAPLAAWLAPDGTPLAGRMWFVDPRGNLMMQYPPGAEARGIRKDFGKLVYLNKV